jgi:hypothetical protein
MKASWHGETGDLACRWSEGGQRVQYRQLSIQDIRGTIKTAIFHPFRTSPAHCPLAALHGSSPNSHAAIFSNRDFVMTASSRGAIRRNVWWASSP